MQIDVIYGDPGGPGWGPLRALAELAARLFSTELETIDCSISRSRRQRLGALVPRRRGGGRAALYISPKPASLEEFGVQGLNRRGYDYVAAWVIDSFWHERVRRTLRMSNHFDQIYVARESDRDFFHSASGGIPVGVLPWGADVLGAMACNLHQQSDLLKFGRQPPAWRAPDFEALAQAHGIRLGSIPPQQEDSLASHTSLMPALAATRSVVAFSHLVDGSEYTHPTEEYLTGRWTDALAHGCIVFGQAPGDKTSRDLLWAGSTVDISPTNVNEGLEQIRQHLETVSPEDHLAIQREAARRLDWRWRLAQVVDESGASTPRLADDLAQLRHLIR